MPETDETASGERCLEQQRLEFQHLACLPAEETAGLEGAEPAERPVALRCCPWAGGLEFAGRITDAGGQPFEGAESHSNDAGGSAFTLAGRSAADGSFRLRYQGPAPALGARAEDRDLAVALGQCAALP